MTDFCVITGCGKRAPMSPRSGKSLNICHEHWYKLSLQLRLDYWRTTQYGTLPVPADLKQRMENYLKVTVPA